MFALWRDIVNGVSFGVPATINSHPDSPPQPLCRPQQPRPAPSLLPAPLRGVGAASGAGRAN
jgi:hypothetical protein